MLFSFTNNINLALTSRAAGHPGVRSPQCIRSIRERDWVYARYFDPGCKEQEFELYDLRNDPLELHNLADDPGYRARERELAEKLKAAEEKEMGRSQQEN